MTHLASIHDEHGARYTQRGGRRVVANYGRPARVHRAVRKGAGLIERPLDVVVVAGEDRHDFVDDAVSNRVPTADGDGIYALLLDPQGRVESDMYVLVADERLLVLTPPGEGEPLAEAWRETTFIQDVTVEARTDDFGVFGVHGPQATEKVASVFSAQTPAEPLSFVRGSMRDHGVTVVREDGLVGEDGYLVVSGAPAAERVFDTLETHGLNAAPFGLDTWDALTLEAGTPLFETEIAGRIPNDLGLDNALDFEKGCFVGQEVVSRIENRGEPANRLVGVVAEAMPGAGAAVLAGDDVVGEVTRAVESPMLEAPIAFALVESGVAADALSVRVAGEEVAAEHRALPFVEGSERSARLPTYR
ncbi:MAG: glycine cleavage T C-terminal barrel domain-containing protein [Haloarculaceae archaeon]